MFRPFICWGAVHSSGYLLETPSALPKSLSAKISFGAITIVPHRSNESKEGLCR